MLPQVPVTKQNQPRFQRILIVDIRCLHLTSGAATALSNYSKTFQKVVCTQKKQTNKSIIQNSFNKSITLSEVRSAFGMRNNQSANFCELQHNDMLICYGQYVE